MPRSVQSLLGVGHTAQLLEQVRLLQSLTTQLRRCLDNEAAKHIQVAAFTDKTLIVQTDSAIWATRFRYLTPQLLQCLHETTHISQLQRLKIHVAPRAEPDKPILRPMTLSMENAAILDALADNIDHPALRHALQRLASRAKQDR
ncbi:MAG: DUF721 domain-containing protein [Thiohalomonadaceae bacterium]